MNIKEELTCKHCNETYTQPIILSCCGENICKQHLDEFDETISCKFCNTEHEIPLNGFVINEKIQSKINEYFELNPLRKKIRDTFDSINESVTEYDEINADAYVYDYFGCSPNIKVEDI